MPASELSFSSAVQTAWKIAAGVARASGSDIEPAQFLYGIFSLDNLAQNSLSREFRSDLLVEVEALERVCRQEAIDFQSVRRRIRSQEALSAPNDSTPPTASALTGKTNRSEAVRRAFENALPKGNPYGQGQVPLLRLCRALLSEEPNACALLGVDSSSLERFLIALDEPHVKNEARNVPEADSSLEGLSIFDSLDANAQATEQVADARID